MPSSLCGNSSLLAIYGYREDYAGGMLMLPPRIQRCLRSTEICDYSGRFL
jgi:hypothetical protein